MNFPLGLTPLSSINTHDVLGKSLILGLVLNTKIFPLLLTQLYLIQSFPP